MKEDEKRLISARITDAERLLRQYKLNTSEKLALQKIVEAEHWLWADDPDI